MPLNQFHFAPHPGANFEGFYTKFDISTGDVLIFIICTVRTATSPRKHYINLTYIPGPESRPASRGDVSSRGSGGSAGSRTRNDAIYQEHLFPETLEMIRGENPSGSSFKILARTDSSTEQIDASVNVNEDGSIVYSFRHVAPGVSTSFNATTSSRDRCLAWASDLGPRSDNRLRSYTPEGWLVHLPLPLHWHVESLAAPAEISLSLDQFDGVVVTGEATAHTEKNWAVSFPKAHIWIQGRNDCDSAGVRHGSNDSLTHEDETRARPGVQQYKSSFSTVCLAGGRILGLEAYLIGYRNPNHNLNITIRPPFALRALAGLLAPFLALEIDYPARRFELCVSDWRHKIRIRATAARDTFFTLDAPQREGHREADLTESVAAKVEVEVWRRKWWLLGWTRIVGETFEKATLEFGGSYYDDRGKKTN